MSRKLVAHSSTTIDAPAKEVWNALVTPATIKKYMFGTNVTSDFKPGSPISWKGEWEGKSYEDKGEILEVKPPQRLQYSHFSPLTGLPETKENYHTVTIELSPRGEKTEITLSQDNNATEEAKKHSEKNWGMMLSSLKKVLEGK